MAFIEDQQLIQLSLSPKKSLFPVLGRAEAMSPLVVLLALLPPLFVLVNRTLTPLDALWGIKAVAIANADSSAGWIDPGTLSTADQNVPLKWQPPLSSWIIAGMMKLTGTERPLALVIGSFLATSGLIVVVFGFTDRLKGPQFAWWTTCLTALSGPLLLGGQTPAPVSLTLVFGVAACWGFVAHCQDYRRVYSLPLIWAGIAWGLCLLSGGPVALVILPILGAYVLSLGQDSHAPKKVRGGVAHRRWQVRPGLQSLALFFLIGFFVGGWWEILLYARFQTKFLTGWLVGDPYLRDPAAASVAFGWQMLRDVSQMGGAICGLSLLGLGAAIWLLNDSEFKQHRPALVLMLAWSFCAAIAWLWLRAESGSSSAFAVVWRGFCLLPITMMAAFALECIRTRRIGFFGVLFAICFTAAVLLLSPVELGWDFAVPHRPLWESLHLAVANALDPASQGNLKTLWRILFVLSLLASVCWTLRRFLLTHELRQRAFLGFALVGFVAMHGLIGFLGVQQVTVDDRALSNWRAEMVDEKGVGRWTIVAPTESPLALWFSLRSLWPHAESSEVHSWLDLDLTRDISDGKSTDGSHLVVDWNDRDARPPTVRLTDKSGDSHIIEFTPVGSPRILWGHRLQVYRLADRVIPKENRRVALIEAAGTPAVTGL